MNGFQISIIIAMSIYLSSAILFYSYLMVYMIEKLQEKYRRRRKHEKNSKVSEG